MLAYPHSATTSLTKSGQAGGAQSFLQQLSIENAGKATSRRRHRDQNTAIHWLRTVMTPRPCTTFSTLSLNPEEKA
ncbi:kinase domain containing protein [Aspergillus luchuensis]|uniref:Kinase domain containing protein n=1 Tax=Aspergillus kawachii TaxID=1069201 RepID=A0A146FWX2_ASPKA|nr:kinase domain containing protein [Aspergillus luchuensis]